MLLSFKNIRKLGFSWLLSSAIEHRSHGNVSFEKGGGPGFKSPRSHFILNEVKYDFWILMLFRGLNAESSEAPYESENS